MDAVSQSVNWSQTAAEAFERKLDDLKSQQEVKTDEDMIARFQAAAKLEAEEDYQDGLEAGRDWVRCRAKRPGDLRRIARYIEESEEGSRAPIWWAVGDPAWGGHFGATERFVLAAWPAARDDASLFTQFWNEALGKDNADRIKSGEFLHGFGDGVVEVWGVIRNKLYRRD